MTCAAYIRISTQQQKDDLQRAELAEFCRRQGWECIPYIEHESTRKARPVLDRLLADVAAKRIGTVAVYKLDRFGRSVRELVDNIEALDRAGCRFIAITQGIDTDQRNPTSRLLLHVMAAFASFERDIIAERRESGTAAYRAAVAAGKPVSSRSGKNRPIGRPRVLLDRVRLAELVAQGRSVREIAHTLGVSDSVACRAARAVRDVTNRDSTATLANSTVTD
jgi:DNA invertase Pin-like site-specific DNA recombinase